jgi:hypothetical protein
MRCHDSCELSEELRTVAGMPAAVSASTWSFMSAINGETTTVRPVAEGLSTAGRQQREDVAIGEHVAYDRFLKRPEAIETEEAFEFRVQQRAVRDVAGRHEAIHSPFIPPLQARGKGSWLNSSPPAHRIAFLPGADRRLRATPRRQVRRQCACDSEGAEPLPWESM